MAIKMQVLVLEVELINCLLMQSSNSPIRNSAFQRIQTKISSQTDPKQMNKGLRSATHQRLHVERPKQLIMMNKNASQSPITVSQFEVEQDEDDGCFVDLATPLQMRAVSTEMRKQSMPQQPKNNPLMSQTPQNRQEVMRTKSSNPNTRYQNRIMNRNLSNGTLGFQAIQLQKRRQPQPQVVIQINSSKAMTLSNYKSLAKMVSKQRIKQEAPSEGQSATTVATGQDSGGKSFFSKQKMLESRIEKLRSVENQVKTESACSKKNCPVSLDPRTTSERIGNDSALQMNGNDTIIEESGQEVRERIERFRNSQKALQKHQQQPQSLIARKKKDLAESKEGLFKLNDRDKDIKTTAADEVWFNFMRRHQVVEETANIPLSELIRQNQERAVRNMIKTQEKEKRQQEIENLKSGGGDMPDKSYCAASSAMNRTGALTDTPQYQSHNLLSKTATANSQFHQLADSNAMMLNTFTGQMKSGNILKARNSMMATTQQNSASSRNFAKVGNRSGTAAPGARHHFQSRNTLGPQYRTSMSNFPSQSGLGMKSAASLEVLQRAVKSNARAPSPELEKKDEFAASSLWKMASRANQEDFREVFKSEAQKENSEELENKLRDLINSQKHKPAIEPTSQVSPRTIKYLCNVIMQEGPSGHAYQSQKGGVSWHSPEKANDSVRESSIPASYQKKLTNKNLDQMMKSGRNSNSIQSYQQNNTNVQQNRSILRLVTESHYQQTTEEKFDPDGKVSTFCRPLLKEQKEKLIQLLTDKKASQEAAKQDATAEDINLKTGVGAAGIAPTVFMGQNVQKSVAMVQQLQRDLNESPTLKAKHRAQTKNEILEICEKQFPAEKPLKATRYERAMELYTTQKSRLGVIKNDVVKPETMAHFHIEAFGDKIECNRYETSAANQILQTQNDATPSNDLIKMNKMGYMSSTDINASGKKKPNMRISMCGIQQKALNLEKSYSAQHSARVSDITNSQFAADSQDSVFSTTMNTLREQLNIVMAESPEVPRRKEARKRLHFNYKGHKTASDVHQFKFEKHKRSVLLTKEYCEELDYFTKVDLPVLARFDQQTAILAYKILNIASKPVFSGALDHRINILDLKKVQTILEMGQDQYRQILGDGGATLIEEFKAQMDKLKDKGMYHGYWDCIHDVKGCLPESRKGASMNLIGNEVYIFGGFSINTYQDMKVFDIFSSRWREVETSTMRVIPEPRVSHTMVKYNNSLILFGGCGAYMPNLQMMPSFNDIWMFDTDSMNWSKLEGSGIPPKKRMGHVSSVLGCLMLVHGGYNCESKLTLDDFTLFDAEEHKWIKTRILMNGKVIESDTQYGSTLDSDDSDVAKLNTIGARMGHCIATVYMQTPDRYLTTTAGTHSSQRANVIANQDRIRRGMWIQEQTFSRDDIAKGKEFKEGFYIFGGMNKDEEKLNDLWLIKPEHYTNKRMIHEKTYKYTRKDPELTLNVQQITNIAGQPPCPRSGATMIHLNIKKAGHQMLVIYGGRNDKIFEYTRSVALNDVCMFNINLKQWETLAIFGQLPMSRWKHSMVAMSDEQSTKEGFMIFGGANLSCYCRSKIFTFTLMNKRSKPKAQNKDFAAKVKDQQDLGASDPTIVHFQAQPSYQPAQSSVHGGNKNVIRDDISHRSAIKSSFARKSRTDDTTASVMAQTAFMLTSKALNNIGVNFAPQTAMQSQSPRKLAALTQNLMQMNNAMQSALTVVPENIFAMANQQQAQKNEVIHLGLGKEYEAFQETIRQRVEILRDLLTRPKQGESENKSAKKRSQNTHIFK